MPFFNRLSDLVRSCKTVLNVGTTCYSVLAWLCWIRIGAPFPNKPCNLRIQHLSCCLFLSSHCQSLCCFTRHFPSMSKLCQVLILATDCPSWTENSGRAAYVYSELGKHTFKTRPEVLVHPVSVLWKAERSGTRFDHQHREMENI